jgi:type IV secretion/conjugal transfer VirB4 family ATPase
MFSLREYRNPTDRLPDYLPWACLVAPGVVLQKDGVLQKTIAFRGPDLASSSASELISAVARLNNALKRLGSGWAFFFEAQRFEATRYPSSRWRHAAAWIVDFERRAAFESAGSHFESGYFLTVVWQLPPLGEKRLQALFFSDPERRSAQRDNARDLAVFEKAVAELLDIMEGVFADVTELDDAETLSYLHSTVSTNRHPVAVPETPMYLDALLPDMPFTPGDIPMLGDSFLPTCTVVGFPGTSLPGLLDDLNHLEMEYRWVTRYICLDKQDAKSEIEKYRKRWWSKRKGLWTMLKEEATKQESALLDNAAANQAADADAALQELGDDLVGFGYLTATVTVWDPDQRQARRKLQAVKQAIQARGFVVREEGLNGREAWLGSLPGHVWANIRRPLVSSLNLAHLLPLSAVWAGESENAHLRKVCGRGEPHVYCSTAGATPFRLNLNVDDVGHTLVVGPTGAGKSTLLSLLTLQWLRYPGAQVVIFDKDRSSRAATIAVGGLIYEPGNDRAPTAFQPLRRIDDRAERAWASRFVLNLLMAQRVEETPEIKRDIDQALELTASAPIDQRTLTNLTLNLASLDLKTALRPYTIQGAYGQIFDADHEDLGESFWQMYEMGHLMGLGPDVVAPALDYLFHRVEERLDGRPTLMVLDEAWLFLAHPIFARRLQAWLKTLRKKNVYVVFATQEVADAAQSPITATIVSACHTKIYLADEEALTPALMKAYIDFGLTDTEVHILASAQKKRDYYYRSVKGRRLFRLDLGPVALAYAGMSSPDDHRFFDELIATAPAIEHAERILRHRGIEWAAVRVAEARQGGAVARESLASESNREVST